jgi:hypothetical protein
VQTDSRGYKIMWLKRERNGPPKRRIYATATKVMVRGMNIFFS